MHKISDEHELLLFVQTPEELRGNLTVEINCNGKPVEAREFAMLIINTVKCLNACEESKSIKWGIVEIGVIGDVASFTLKGYEKEVFATEKRRKPKD